MEKEMFSALLNFLNLILMRKSPPESQKASQPCFGFELSSISCLCRN